MEPTIIDFLSNHQLARMLNVDGAVRWSPDDKAAALRHQLNAPLLPDLAQVPGGSGRIERAVCAAGPGATFLNQILAPRPPWEILEAIKEFGRTMRDQLNSPLSGGPATSLYFAAIASALLGHNRRITQLSDAELQAGFIWGRTQMGAEELTPLFESALSKLARCD